jgi:hypothetical protein
MEAGSTEIALSTASAKTFARSRSDVLTRENERDVGLVKSAAKTGQSTAEECACTHPDDVYRDHAAGPMQQWPLGSRDSHLPRLRAFATSMRVR